MQRPAWQGAALLAAPSAQSAEGDTPEKRAALFRLPAFATARRPREALLPARTRRPRGQSACGGLYLKPSPAARSGRCVGSALLGRALHCLPPPSAQSAAGDTPEKRAALFRPPAFAAAGGREALLPARTRRPRGQSACGGLYLKPAKPRCGLAGLIAPHRPLRMAKRPGTSSAPSAVRGLIAGGGGLERRRRL
jgi:hypothetical protein